MGTGMEGHRKVFFPFGAFKLYKTLGGHWSTAWKPVTTTNFWVFANGDRQPEKLNNLFFFWFFS